MSDDESHSTPNARAPRRGWKWIVLPAAGIYAFVAFVERENAKQIVQQILDKNHKASVVATVREVSLDGFAFVNSRREGFAVIEVNGEAKGLPFTFHSGGIGGTAYAEVPNLALSQAGVKDLFDK